MFLDEIDGLLQSRSGAQRSWEVTQVNELLRQMENFDGVLVGATNFIKNLDEAASRRFTFNLNSAVEMGNRIGLEGQRPDPYQPRATPWVSNHTTFPALKGRPNPPSIRTPFQGLGLFLSENPGRCPGLDWIRPLAFQTTASPSPTAEFRFKLQFDWLDTDGKRLFFERMFNASLSEPEAARLARIPNLAPGDFRTARQSLYYLGGETTNTARLDALERESEAKANNIFAEKRRIGFT